MSESATTDSNAPAIRAVTDAEPAQWFIDALEPSFTTVGGLVPGHYEAYARILHPAWRVSRDGEGTVRSPVRWSEVASIRGTKAHRLMQWPGVWGLPAFDDSAIDACVDAGLAPIAGPDEGRLPREVAYPLHDLLARHTHRSGKCWFGVWSGYGSDYKSGVPETLRIATRYREWDVFRAPLGALSYGFLDEPFGDRTFYQPANIVWPEEQSWCVHTEIDLKCTYVGGPESLIIKILGSPHLEAHVAHARDAFWEHDPVNGPGLEPGDRIGLILGNDPFEASLRERVARRMLGLLQRIRGRSGVIRMS